MYQVFNKHALKRNERFIKGAIAGTIASLGLAIAYGIFSSLIRIEFSIIFVAIGYGIGYAIRYYGHGVQLKFSILGAVLAVISFILADLIRMFGFGIFTNFSFFLSALQLYLNYILNFSSLNAMLGLLFRAIGVYEAFYNSRIV